MRSRSSSAHHHYLLAGINNARRLIARVRSNTAENSREQSPLIQASAQEQIPVQPPASILSLLLEISYSPVSDLSPDFFSSSPLSVSHSISSSSIEEFPVSHTTPIFPVQPYAYFLAHLPLLFHKSSVVGVHVLLYPFH